MANPTLYDRIASGKPLAAVRLDPNPTTGTPGNLASSGTISHNGKNYVRVNTAAAVTGVILQVGRWDGQPLWVENVSANSITFAAAATSNVRDGASDVIPANSAKLFIWNAVSSRWTMATDNGSGGMALTGRLDLSGVAVDAANTDGGVIKAGTSAAPVTEDTANMKFVSLYFDDGATSGSAEGIYVRLYDTGAGKTSQALRAFTSVTDVTAGNARGSHISLSFGTSGKVSGLAAALETTLHMPSGGGMGGTNCSLKVAINADGAGSDPAGATEISFVRIEAQGTQAGIDDLEDDGYFFSFQGFTADNDATHMLSSVSLAELPAGTVGLRCKVGSSIYYLPLVAQAQWN